MITMISRGIVTSNAKLMTSKKGDSYLSFNIANHHYGSDNIDTYFFKVLVFDQTLINQVKKCMTKGRDVVVEGNYSDEAWIKRNGEPTVTRKIIADKIEYAKFYNHKKQEKISKEDEDNEEKETVK